MRTLANTIFSHSSYLVLILIFQTRGLTIQERVRLEETQYGGKLVVPEMIQRLVSNRKSCLAALSQVRAGAYTQM